MGDLLARFERDGQRPALETRPPPVPAKDMAPQPAQRPAYTSPYKAPVYKNSRCVFDPLFVLVRDYVGKGTDDSYAAMS